MKSWQFQHWGKGDCREGPWSKNLTAGLPEAPGKSTCALAPQLSSGMHDHQVYLLEKPEGAILGGHTVFWISPRLTRYACLRQPNTRPHQPTAELLQRAAYVCEVRLGRALEFLKDNESFAHSVCSLVTHFWYRETYTSMVSDQVAFAVYLDCTFFGVL